ncbi:MAG: hypothetical protein A3I66_17230 [Burkholderiales bacterium RIFCSPLOWO2_02_FULL_57_36]|nr:MAG: hypothetical protein A3I66_17230 [Burkholderiales bacterium RIFCSPLOWO2_02_FULL_57_36]
MKTLWKILFAGLLLATFPAAQAIQKNGFDLTGALLPLDEILQGGPPRDGIPAIDRPQFVKAGDARFLKNSDRVLGIVRGGIAKAYPVRILNWHEIVNDAFGTERIAVTFCPLCGTGMAYLSETNGKPLNFGVSGLLYNSDVLLYDRQTDSLWSQILSQAVSGPLKGARLTSVPLSHTTWADWKKRHSGTLVLSTDTGFARDYARDPYESYAQNPALLFPVKGQSTRYHPKEQVIGVEVNGKFKAYPFVELSKGPREVVDSVGGQKIIVRFDGEHRTGNVYDAASKEIPSVIAFWFAWYAFHNDTEIYHSK